MSPDGALYPAGPRVARPAGERGRWASAAASFPVEVTLSLFAGTGAPIGTPIERTWAPKEPFQIDDVFSALGAGMESRDGAFVVVHSAAPVFSYALVIDNQSSDPTFIQGVDDSH